MNETVRIEAIGSVPDARTRALDNIFTWMEPHNLEGKRILVLLGDDPVEEDLLERAIQSLSGASHLDLAARSLAGYGEERRAAIRRLLDKKGDLIELVSGEFESLDVPVRTHAREVRSMQVQDRRYLRKVLLARPLVEADLFVVLRRLEVNRFSGVHGVSATILDCVPTKTRAEVLTYASYDLMGEALLDIWAVIPGLFLFAVFDGEHVREETLGITGETGVLIAGIDPEALDGYALIASGNRISFSPFGASVTAHGGDRRHSRSQEFSSNISLEEVRQRVPPGMISKPPSRGLLRRSPVIVFDGRPTDFDTLICPTGALEEGSAGVPCVCRSACVGCRWCLKAYREASIRSG